MKLSLNKDPLVFVLDLEYNDSINLGCEMASFMSAKVAAEKVDISQRRVAEREKQNAVPPKPFVKWAGGKGQLVGELEKMLPVGGERTFTKYVEPMVGGGALLFTVLAKYDFEQVYISDINAGLVNAYRVIKNDVDSLVARLSEMQRRFLPMDENGRKECYYAARETFNRLALSEENAVEKAALFIFLNKTCFNGLYRVNRKGQFNVPMGAYKNPCICDEDNLRNVSNALQNVEIVCGDYSLSSRIIDEKTFVYLDPPYRPISETSAFTSYNADAFDDNEQIRLARFIDEMNKAGAKIVLSNSDPQNVDEGDTFFEKLYRSYKIKKVSATRMINSRADSRGKIKELLICN